MRDFPEMYNKYHHLPWQALPEEYKNNLRRKSLMFFYMIWMFMGVFTSQGLLFGLFITFQMVIFNPATKMIIKKYGGVYNKAYIRTQWVSAVISVAFLCFMLYNKYALHINLWSNVKNTIE
jgi:hypothetical protein